MSNRKVEVSLKVRAIDFGYIKGRMYRPGEEFTFRGVVETARGLAHWMEAVNEADLAKALAAKVEAPEAPEVPVAPEGTEVKEAPEGETPAQELTPAQKAAATRARKKAEAEAAEAGTLLV